MAIRKKPGERKTDFISRCIGIEVSSGMKVDQASAVCYAKWEEISLKEIRLKRKKQKMAGADILKALKGRGQDFTKFGISFEDLLDPHTQNRIDEEYEHLLTFAEVPEGYVVRYKYVGPLDEKSRPFCRTMMTDFKDTWFSREDIEALNTAPGKADRKGGKPYSVFNWRGGSFCRHQWVRYYFNEETGDVLKTPVQPQQKSTKPKKK